MRECVCKTATVRIERIEQKDGLNTHHNGLWHAVVFSLGPLLHDAVLSGPQVTQDQHLMFIFKTFSFLLHFFFLFLSFFHQVNKVVIPVPHVTQFPMSENIVTRVIA